MTEAPPVGTHVAIIRARHGWHDGRVEGVITHRHQRPTGTWSFMVRGDDGTEYDVEHQRDMRVLR